MPTARRATRTARTSAALLSTCSIRAPARSAGGNLSPELRLIRVHFEGGDEGFLRDFDLAELAHLLLALFLLVEELALAGDVAAIALGRNALAERLDALARD